MLDPWGWHKLDREAVGVIQSKLRSFESMTWNEILVIANKQNHSVEVEKLCPRAQEELERIGYGDLDKVVSLRLSSVERIWGVLNEGVLTLLWWDPKHEICPSLPKNT